MKLIDLCEMPYLHLDDLKLKQLPNISMNRFEQSYTKIATLNRDLGVFQHNINKGIVAGKQIEDQFHFILSINVRFPAYPIIPAHLDSNYLQVSMVNITKGSEEQGITKETYLAVIANFDLVSDHEQYFGAQGLWKALARRSEVNIYVYDGKDYVRENGTIVRYNGKNLADFVIWGQRTDHHTTLLVATTKTLS